MPRAGLVTLEIYNILCREVPTFIAELNSRGNTKLFPMPQDLIMVFVFSVMCLRFTKARLESRKLYSNKIDNFINIAMMSK